MWYTNENYEFISNQTLNIGDNTLKIIPNSIFFYVNAYGYKFDNVIGIDTLNVGLWGISDPKYTGSSITVGVWGCIITQDNAYAHIETD